LSQFQQNLGSQSYHTANYRGNQAGHDNYLRADSTSPSNVQGGFTGASVNASFGGQNVGTQQFGQQVSPQAYHTSNYRGDQAGHDNYLRADSTQPSSVGAQGGFRGATNTTSSVGGSFGGGFATSTPVNGFGVGGQSAGRSQFGQTNVGVSSYSQQQSSPQAYHTANYRGDQAGHDNYLRADSTQPSSGGVQGGFRGATNAISSVGGSFGGGFATSTPVNGFGVGGQSAGRSQFGQTNVGVSSYSQHQSGQQQSSPQAYHSANYRGDQAGHDNYLRADSTQPSSVGAQGGFRGATNTTSPAGSSFGGGFATSTPVNGFGVQSTFSQPFGNR
jgi:hypothetical protein